MENTLTIIRRKKYFDYFRAYRIMVDGKFVDDINDQPISFTTDKSSVEVQATIDWCTSNIKEVDFTESNNMTIIVENNMKDSLFILMGLFFITLGVYYDVKGLMIVGGITGARLFYNLIFKREEYLKISTLEELESKPVRLLPEIK